MSTIPFDAYENSSIEDLMNEDLWTLDDSQLFSSAFSNQEDDWPEDEEESIDDLEGNDDDDAVVAEDEEPIEHDDTFDWFNERSPIYDV